MINNNKKTIPIVLGKPSVSKEEVEEIAEDVVRDIAYEKEDEIFIGKTTDETPIIVLDGDEEGVNITPTEISFDTPDGANKNITPEKINKWDAMASAGLTREVVETLPTEGIKTNVIYLVPNGESEGENVYTEYMYISGKWETVGSTRVDLSDYYTKEEVDAEINKIPKHWFGTQEEYDALGEYDENTIYHIEGGSEGGRKAFKINVLEVESEETIATVNEIFDYVQEVGNTDFDVYASMTSNDWYVATNVYCDDISLYVAFFTCGGGYYEFMAEKNADDTISITFDENGYTLVDRAYIEDKSFEDYGGDVGYAVETYYIGNQKSVLYTYDGQPATFLRFDGSYAEIQIDRYIYSFQQWDDEEGTRWYRWIDNDDFKKEEILTDANIPASKNLYRLDITGYGETENVSEITGYKVLDTHIPTLESTLNQFVQDNLQDYITNGFLKPFDFVIYEQADYQYDREYNTTSSADITLTSQTTASITISANAQIEDKLLSFNAVGSINAVNMGTTWDVVELSEGSTLEQGGSNSWYGTQAEYNALPEYDENTNYFISDALSYNDLTDKPTIPARISQLTDDMGYATEIWVNNKGFSKFDGDYNSLTNKPTIPSTTKALTFTFDDGTEETINVYIQ